MDLDDSRERTNVLTVGLRGCGELSGRLEQFGIFFEEFDITVPALRISPQHF